MGAKSQQQGLAPPGLYEGVCTTVSESLYHFGGWDGHSNTTHFTVSTVLHLSGHKFIHRHLAISRCQRSNCGMVTYHEEADGVTSLAVFAGLWKPITPTQPGSSFVKSTAFTDGRGWTNELHLFNLTNGM